MSTRKFFTRHFHQPAPPDRIEAGPDLPPEQAALAWELRTLSDSTHPDEAFVARLEGRLIRQMARRRDLAPPPRFPVGARPSLAGRLRRLMRTAWGWMLPAGALVLLIILISLLLQTRPRGATIPASDVTATNPQPTEPTPSPLPRPAQRWTSYYTVKEGDTLQGIANLYGVTVNQLLNANELGTENTLTPGTMLTIPSSSIYPAPGVHYYYVHEGDTPASIAGSFGVTVESLLEANHLVAEGVPYVGMTLIIPSSAVYPPPGGSTYTVQEGDTLEGISRQFTVDLQALLDANNLFADIQLSVGQSLLIPQAGAASDLFPGEPVPFEICGESVNWTRPSETDQKARWWDDPRYAGVDPAVIQYPWRHYFFVSYGDASLDYDLLNLSGLWTLPENARAGCLEPSAQEAVVNLQKAEIWVLFHRVIGVSRAGSDYYIVVQPVTQGVRFIQFDRPEPQKSLTLHFVTGNGQELQKIVEAENPSWPYPQLVGGTPMPVTYYIVQDGDTLSGIADYFGVTVEALLEANNMKEGGPFVVGQSLIVPEGRRATATPPANYIVQEGDTLSGIAAYFGVTVEALLEANNMKEGDPLMVGQSLVIPQRATLTATPMPSPTALPYPPPFP